MAASARRIFGEAVASVVLAVALVCIASAGPAAADSPHDFGYTGGSDGIRSPDDKEHRQCQPGSPSLASSFNSALANLDSQTVMWDLIDGTCQTYTDVVWAQVGWGDADGAYGYTTCVRHSAWGVCDQFWLVIDPTSHYFSALSSCGARYTSGTGTFNTCVAWEYDLNLNLTLRHELGHSAGLHHFWNYVFDPPFHIYNVYSQPPQLTSSWRTMVSAWVPYGAGHSVSNFLGYNSTHVGIINANVP